MVYSVCVVLSLCGEMGKKTEPHRCASPTFNLLPEMSISLVRKPSCVPEPSLELFNHNIEH